MRLFCLSAEQIDAVWPDLEGLLDPHADLTPEQLKRNAKESKQQIWGFNDDRIRGIYISEIIQTSRGLICLIVSAKVDRGVGKPLMQRLHDEIGTWARGLGCVAMRIHGRKGWLRWDRRYRQTGIVAERPL